MKLVCLSSELGLWMNESKRIDNPRIKNRNFQYKKFSFIELVLTYGRNLSGTPPKSACGKSSSCWFSFSAARNAITKAAEYVTFGFNFPMLVFFPF